MASIDLGDGSGTDVLNGTVNYLSGGGSYATLLGSSIAGFVISPLIAGMDIVNSIGHFVSQPFMSGGNAIGDLFQALIGGPTSVLKTGADITSQSLNSFLGGTFLGIGGLFIATGVVLASLYLIARYRREKETGNEFPGLPFDVPFVGADEEETVDE